MTFLKGGNASIKTNLITMTCLDCGWIDHFSYKGETVFSNELNNRIMRAQQHADQKGHRISNFMSVQWVYTGTGFRFDI